jgi:diguanylate cyclase (GGDEF)-like protein
LLAGTAGAIVVSVVVTYLLLLANPIWLFPWAMACAVLIALLIAIPAFVYAGLQSREAARLRSQMREMMSTDRLTSCLDPTVFPRMVDEIGMLERRRRGHAPGALLAVEIEGLKEINNRFGYQWGNEALRTVAQAIRGAVRKSDLVGRVGGTSFNVFLPGADRKDAEGVGERVSRAIQAAVFHPRGEEYALTVTVRGILFDEQIDFDGLHVATAQTEPSTLPETPVLTELSTIDVAFPAGSGRVLH